MDPVRIAVAEEKEAGFKVGLKAASVGIIALSILMVVLIVMGLAFRSQGVAVDSTRDTHLEAVDKCFATADVQILIQFNSYINTFTAHTHEKVLAFLENIRRIGMKHHFIFMTEMRSQPLTKEYLAGKLVHFQAELINQRANGLVALGVVLSNESFLALEDTSTLGLPEDAFHKDVVLHGGPTTLYLSDIVDGAMSGPPRIFPQLSPERVPGYRVSIENPLAADEPHWSGAYAFYQYVGSDVIIPFTLPNGGTTGAIIARNDLRAVSDFLRRSAHEAQDSSTFTLRLFAYVHCNLSSHVPQGDSIFPIKVHNDVGTLMGVSHGDHQWLEAESSQPIQPIKLHQAHDNLIRGIGVRIACTDVDRDAAFCEGVPEMEKHEEGHVNISLVDITYVHQAHHEHEPNDEDWYEDEISNGTVISSTFYVATKDILDYFGTTWRLCVVVDHLQLSENVTTTIVELKKDLKKSDDEVQTDVSRDRVILAFTVVGIGLLMAALASILTSMLLKPLTKLQHQMENVACMKLDKVDTEQPPSTLREVALMQTSFLSMLKRLKEYRLYVPKLILHDDTSSEARTPSPLEEEDDIAQEDTRAEPMWGNPLVPSRSPISSHDAGAPAGDKLALVFTDIQSSTQLWGILGNTAMRGALNLHNEVMRKQLKEAGGYEVKTIGDAFMTAFEHVFDSVRFALSSQVELVKASWPSVLTRHSETAKVTNERSQVIWNGLRVRMGIHFGPVLIENNPITNRFDYFGPTVNLAARVEGQAVGGLVVITRSVLDALGSDGIQRLDYPKLVHIGMKELKGITDAVDLMGLLPNSLCSRDETILLQLAEKEQHASSDPEHHSTHFINARLRTHLRATDATVVYIRPAYHTAFPTEMDNMQAVLQFTNSVISAAEISIDRTGGMILDGVGGNLTITFNVTKTCKSHARKAAAFLGSMYTCVNGKVHVGVATGTVAVGNIGGKRHRFSTVLGHTSELASWLASAAGELNTFALTVSPRTPPVGIVKEQSTNIRPVDKWQYMGTEVLVYEVKCLALAPFADAWEKFARDTEIWSTKGLLAALSGDMAELRKDVKSHPSDAVLKKVLTMLERGASLRPTGLTASLKPTAPSENSPSSSATPGRTGQVAPVAQVQSPPLRRESEASSLQP